MGGEILIQFIITCNNNNLKEIMNLGGVLDREKGRMIARQTYEVPKEIIIILKEKISHVNVGFLNCQTPELANVVLSGVPFAFLLVC